MSAVYRIEDFYRRSLLKVQLMDNACTHAEYSSWKSRYLGFLDSGLGFRTEVYKAYRVEGSGLT